MVNNLLGGYNPNAGRVNLLYGAGGEGVGAGVQTPQQLECIRNGGTWDPITGTCALPNNRDVVQTDPFADINPYAPAGSQRERDGAVYSGLKSDLNRWDSDVYGQELYARSQERIDAANHDNITNDGSIHNPFEANRGYGNAEEIPEEKQHWFEKLILNAFPIFGSMVKAADYVIEKYTTTQHEALAVKAAAQRAEDVRLKQAEADSAAAKEASDSKAADTLAAQRAAKDAAAVQAAQAQTAAHQAQAAQVAAQDNRDRQSSGSQSLAAATRAQLGKTNAYSAANKSSSSQYSGGQGYYNKGGHIPNYNEGGDLLNHPFEREGEQFDTVPARLTEGEFVIDADSTHVFKPLLEEINKWEPGEDIKLGGLLSKKGEKMTITKDMGNGRKMSVTSGEDDEMMTEDAEMMLATNAKSNLLMSDSMSEPQGLNQGGTLRDLLSGTQNSYDRQRQNALAGAQTKARGAGLNAGIQALGKGFDNRTAQTGAAGFRTNSLGSFGPNGYQGANFSARTAPDTNFGKQLQAIGQGQQEIGNAGKGYQDALGSIANAEYLNDQTQANRAEDRENTLADNELKREQELEDNALDRAEKQEKKDEAKSEDIQKFTNIANDIGKAIEAVDNARPAFSAYKTAIYTANKVFGAASLIPAVNADAISQTRDNGIDEYMINAIGKGEGKITQSAYNAWQEMEQLIKRLAQLILNTQTGTKTDFDFQVAAQQIADTSSGNADSIIHNLNVALDDANRSIEQLGGEKVNAPTITGGAAAEPKPDTKLKPEVKPEVKPAATNTAPAETNSLLDSASNLLTGGWSYK